MALTVIKASGGGTGSSFPGTNPPIFVNSNTISVNASIDSGTNGISSGPITIATGITVNVATGSRWVIV
jgi:hypothetical protein